MKKEERIPYSVSPQGSLGLLCLGAVGIRAWREAKSKEKPPRDEQD